MPHFIRSRRTLRATKVVWTEHILPALRRPVLYGAVFGAVPGAVFGALLCSTPTSPAQTPAPTAPPALTAATPAVQAIPGIGNAQLSPDKPDKPAEGKAAADKPAAAPTRKSTTLTLDGAQWLDTGVVVSGGEQVAFTATGTITLADGRGIAPAGLDRGWKDLLRQFPLNSANTGSLIGRVGSDAASVPFAIGDTATVTMPVTGTLFLRANLSTDLSVSGGGFHVVVRPLDATASAPTTGAAVLTPATPVASLVSPALFATIPRRVADQAGDPGDMVNFAILGAEPQVKAAFRNAGWVSVDKTTQDAVLHGLLSTLQHQAYVEMPMSTLFLFGRAQDLSFARADPLTVAAERHHLRVWKTTQTIDGRPLWVGSATHDIGFERDQRNGGTTHKIDPNIDLERIFLLDSFNAAGNLTSAAYVLPANPLLTARTATGGSFHSDGRIVVLDLAPSLK